MLEAENPPKVLLFHCGGFLSRLGSFQATTLKESAMCEPQLSPGREQPPIAELLPSVPSRPSVPQGKLKKSNEKYAKMEIVVKLFRVNSKILTLKMWFSHGLISKILV